MAKANAGGVGDGRRPSNEKEWPLLVMQAW